MSEYKLYFIVNSSLKMGIGKTAGQVGHACSYFIRNVYEYNRDRTNYEIWLKNSEPKIILKINDNKHFQDIYSKLLDDNFDPMLITDAGRTQIAPNSNTVIVFGPTKKPPSYISELKLL